MNPSIFRAYDIRGVCGKDFSVQDFRLVGNAFAGFAKHTMMVGRDCRLSSPAIKAELMKGLAAAGIDVLDTGMAPKGAMLRMSSIRKVPSLYVTASHLPPEWNGVKFTYPEGRSLTAKDSERIKQLALSGAEKRGGVPGMVEQTPVLAEFRKFLKLKIPLMEKPLRVLLDCGNGTAGLSAPDAFADHGCEATALYAEPDGNFPSRPSEIKENTLAEAMKMAKDFDMVVAFDGDADRIALVDNKGRYMKVESTAYLIMAELLKTQKGPVIANVECSRMVDKAAEKFGRKVVRTPVGYTYVMDAVHKHKASIGIEKSMHFILPSILPMDCGIISGLYAAYALSRADASLADFVDSTPRLVNDIRGFSFPDDNAKDSAMAELRKEMLSRSKKASTMDGVRLEFDSGWVLIRPSNTSPVVRISVEGEDRQGFDSLMSEYWALLGEVARKYNGKPE